MVAGQKAGWLHGKAVRNGCLLLARAITAWVALVDHERMMNI